MDSTHRNALSCKIVTKSLYSACWEDKVNLLARGIMTKTLDQRTEVGKSCSTKDGLDKKKSQKCKAILKVRIMYCQTQRKED